MYIYIYIYAYKFICELDKTNLSNAGGTTCLTLLVQRRLSSKVANHVATHDDP